MNAHVCSCSSPACQQYGCMQARAARHVQYLFGDPSHTVPPFADFRSLADINETSVVAVEFFDKKRELVPIHRVTVVFRDGSWELVDVRERQHMDTAGIFAAAISAAVEQKRLGEALKAQAEHLRERRA